MTIPMTIQHPTPSLLLCTLLVVLLFSFSTANFGKWRVHLDITSLRFFLGHTWHVKSILSTRG
jgi:hypothetical protein